MASDSFTGESTEQLSLLNKQGVAVLEKPTRYPTLEAVRQAVANCKNCGLCTTRTQTVFSDGNPQARLMIIGEGPGQQEDETGIPFVGRAGQLLTRILESVGLDRQKDTYICNIVKCRPPENRRPVPEEMNACWSYLEAQIHLIKPKVIILAGSTAVEGVLKIRQPISKIRGQWFQTPFEVESVAMPVFHPSYLLRNPSKVENSPKWHTWQDMLKVVEVLKTATE